MRAASQSHSPVSSAKFHEQSASDNILKVLSQFAKA